MSGGRKALVGALTIKSGETTSKDALKLEGKALGCVKIPDTFVGTRLAFKHSFTRDGDYSDVRKSDGTLFYIDNADTYAGDTIIFDAELSGLFWVKICFLNDSDVIQTQTADVEIELGAKS